MKLKVYLLVICFTMMSCSLFAQSDTVFLSRAATSLAGYFNARPIEKVYLHLDNYNYEAGDTVWFKAYVVAGSDHLLSALSGVLYAELIGKKDTLMKRLNLQVNNGLSYGNFIIPDNYDAEICRIRAYTNWMRNEGEGYFYDQTLRVGPHAVATQTGPAAPLTGKIPAGDRAAVETTPQVDVQFFPEGGDLVNGLRSKIAVKAVNAAGFGEDIAGTILDNRDSVAATFDTQHLGMGAFALLPQTGKTYRAKIKRRDSAVFIIDLPKAKEEGFSLTLNPVTGDSVYLKVAANDQLFKKLQHTAFYITGQQNGNLCYTAAAKLESPVFTASIAKKRFKTGILQFTLFSQAGEALNERVVFIQNADQLDLSLNTDTIHHSWEKVKFNLAAKNKDKQPITGSFSVSVTDAARGGQEDGDEPTIFTHLLLSSDMKGYVEQPGYYFTNINDKTRADLDLLMLTQGYRKLVWKQVLDGTGQPITCAPEKGLNMEGLVTSPSGAPVVKGKISITSLKDMLVIDTVTGSTGDFKFENLVFADTAKIVIKATKANNGKNVAIYIKQPDFPVITKRRGEGHSFLVNPAAGELRPAQQTPADTGAGKQMLKQVNINARKAPKPDKYNGYGSVYEYEVNLAQLKDFTSLKEAITRKVPGMSVDAHNRLTYDRSVVTVMINGLRRVQDDLDIYDLSDIESMRVIDGTLTAKPLLMVTTHKFTGRDSIHIKLKEVKIRGKKIEKPGISNMYGSAAPYTVTADRLKDMGPDLNPGLASKIPGLLYSNGCIRLLRDPKILLHIVLNDHELPQIDGGRNFAVNPYNINNFVNTDEVDNIKLLHGMTYKALYGIPYNAALHDEDDIILITTKQYAGTAVPESVKLKEINLKTAPDAKFVTTDLPTSLISYKFKGYYKAPEFYSPKYDNPNTPRKYDPRTTIYWEPGIITDKDGKADFEYFSSGNKGTYRVVVEGIDVSGNLGRQVYFYNVE